MSRFQPFKIMSEIACDLPGDASALEPMAKRPSTSPRWPKQLLTSGCLETKTWPRKMKSALCSVVDSEGKSLPNQGTKGTTGGLRKASSLIICTVVLLIGSQARVLAVAPPRSARVTASSLASFAASRLTGTQR